MVVELSTPSGPVAADALLLLSFGGPESPDEVLPFLRNVTAGRQVPPQRLAQVAQHYQHFGGVSPINACNRAIIAAIQRQFEDENIDLPVYFGNRNWHPLLPDTLARMRDDGVGAALAFVTSAWGGYSACRQYDEDLAAARAAVGPGAPEVVKLRHYFDHPLLIACFADAITAAAAQLPARLPGPTRLVFTAHSVPGAADAAAGPPGTGGHLYSRQVRETAALCAARAGFADYDVVWQSRSGDPRVPWLAPDIEDHLCALADAGVAAVVVCPVGFVSDHMEVVWDLDVQARQRAGELGVAFARAATPGTDPRFARLVADLVTELRTGAAPQRLGTVPSYGCSRNGQPCAVGCCGA